MDRDINDLARELNIISDQLDGLRFAGLDRTRRVFVTFFHPLPCLLSAWLNRTPKMDQVTAENVERLKWYGAQPRVRYYVWGDGPRGVNYEIDGVMSIDGFYCSREEFLVMANKA